MKRLILALAFLFAAAAQASNPGDVIQVCAVGTVAASTTAATVSCTNVAQNNAVVVFAGGAGASTINANWSATDNKSGGSNTYTKRNGVQSDNQAGAWFTTVHTGTTATLTITVAKGGVSSRVGLVALEIYQPDSAMVDGAGVTDANDGSHGDKEYDYTVPASAYDHDLVLMGVAGLASDTSFFVGTPLGTANGNANTGYTKATGNNVTGANGLQWWVEYRAMTTNTDATNAGWTIQVGSRFFAVSGIRIKGFNVNPSIASTSPAPSVAEGATLTINGVNLKAAGNSTVTFGGTSQTVTLQSATAPQITVGLGTNKYGSCQGSAQSGLPLILTDSASAVSNTFSTTGIVPASGWECIDLSGTLASSGSRITAVADVVAGDQLSYETKGTCGAANCVIVASDGSFTADPGVASFQVKAWNNTTDGYGALALQSINAASSTSRAYFFFLTR